VLILGPSLHQPPGTISSWRDPFELERSSTLTVSQWSSAHLPTFVTRGPVMASTSGIAEAVSVPEPDATMSVPIYEDNSPIASRSSSPFDVELNLNLSASPLPSNDISFPSSTPKFLFSHLAVSQCLCSGNLFKMSRIDSLLVFNWGLLMFLPRNHGDSSVILQDLFILVPRVLTVLRTCLSLLPHILCLI